MFPAKSFADNPSQSAHRNQGQICRDCEESIRKLFKAVDRQVFLDDRLTMDQKCFSSTIPSLSNVAWLMSSSNKLKRL